MATEFIWPVRVYYEDTDSGGVVYHANYLRFMERARTEWLRALGFEQDRLAGEEGIIFAVRSLSIDYRAPARFNDALEVRSSLRELRRASMLFHQRIVRADGPERELCSATVSIACVSTAAMRPAAIPPVILEAMNRDRS